jgi:hypothetical protein
VAQKLFAVPSHKLAGYCDYGRVIKLVEGVDEDTSRALRNAGYERARGLLDRHKTLITQLVDYLITNGRIDQSVVRRLLATSDERPSRWWKHMAHRSARLNKSVGSSATKKRRTKLARVSDDLKDVREAFFRQEVIKPEQMTPLQKRMQSGGPPTEPVKLK